MEEIDEVIQRIGSRMRKKTFRISEPYFWRCTAYQILGKWYLNPFLKFWLIFSCKDTYSRNSFSSTIFFVSSWHSTLSASPVLVHNSVSRNYLIICTYLPINLSTALWRGTLSTLYNIVSQSLYYLTLGKLWTLLFSGINERWQF